MRSSLCFLLFGAALALTACGGHYVTRGADLFADGRYVEAAEVFERTQHRLGQSPPAEQARYGLYRGATLFVLGDFAHAQSWLAYATEVERANPGSLEDEERSYLERVRLAVDARFRGLPGNHPNSAVASSPPVAPGGTPGGPAPFSPTPAPTQRSLVGP